MKGFISFFIGAVICSLSLTSCLYESVSPDTWGLEPQLALSRNTVIFNSAVGADTIIVDTNYNSFTVTSNQEWCLVKSEGNKIFINIEPYRELLTRTAQIEVKIERNSHRLSKFISVIQTGGSWDAVGDFNVFWSQRLTETQRDAIIELLNNIVFVHGDTFIMGNSKEEYRILDDSTPHEVTLSSYYIGRYEITQKQWNAVMGNNPSGVVNANAPVYNITWSQALEFTNRLSKLTGLQVKLPTEAQWEFAAIGGVKRSGYIYSGDDDYTKVAYVSDNAEMDGPAPVGSMNPNELGIYDMSGNVAEYCSDWFALEYVDPNKTNPTGPVTGIFKAIRGGNLDKSEANYDCALRCCHRFQFKGITSISPFTGLRIVIVK